MFKIASTFARTGVIALGVLSGFSGMAMTAPLGLIDRPALQSGSTHLVGSDFNIGIGIGIPLFGGYYPGDYGGGAGYYGGYYPRRYYGGYYPRFNYGRSYYPRRYHARRYYDGGNYPRRYYDAGNGHAQRRYARYRSYRAYDNTYQPYNGPRRQCL